MQWLEKAVTDTIKAKPVRHCMAVCLDVASVGIFVIIMLLLLLCVPRGMLEFSLS